MTTPRPAAGPASASGTRRGGDRYQDLFVWGAAMQVIRPAAEFSQVEVEINGVGNVDDVVLRGATGNGDIYGQVKWATNPADLVNAEYLRKKDSDSSTSLLQKFFDSWTRLRGDGVPPTLQLITNRALDRADPLLGHVDGRTDLLVPYAANAGPKSMAGKALQEWAEHVNTSRDQLLEMLGHLQFVTGRAITAEETHVRTLMAVAGLDPSEDALERGLSIVGRWVVDGKRVVTPNDIHDAVDQCGLRRVDPSALLVVQAIDADPHADEATVALDWVPLYDQDQPPKLRAQPPDPASWQQMDRDVTRAAVTLENDGWRSTLVRGALRQATFFRVGAALPGVRGHVLRYLQGQQLWSTDVPKAPIDAPEVAHTALEGGPDLAVAVGVATDPTAAVVEYLRSEKITVAELLTIQPGHRSGRPGRRRRGTGGGLRPADPRPGPPGTGPPARRRARSPVPRRPRRPRTAARSPVELRPADGRVRAPRPGPRLHPRVHGRRLKLPGAPTSGSADRVPRSASLRRQSTAPTTAQGCAAGRSSRTRCRVRAGRRATSSQVLDSCPVFTLMLGVMTTKSEILRFIGEQGALKDSELARLLGATHQRVNQAARGLAAVGAITRVPEPDGVIRNRETSGTTPPPVHEPSPHRRDDAAPSPKHATVLREVAAGAPVTREDLGQLGFVEHSLESVPTADIPEAGLIGWNTLGHIPDAPGLYCFVGQRNPSSDLRVFYVGMTSHLWMVAKGQLPNGAARGGQRYGRPKHAGATRRRVNAEVARMSTDVWTFTQWLRTVEAPAGGAIPEAMLCSEESRLIKIWNLRVVGWNRA